MSACAWCDGRGEVYVHIYAREPAACGWRWMLCNECEGFGEVSEEQVGALETGRAMAADRKRRGLSLREEAKRLGITPAALSRREWGRE